MRGSPRIIAIESLIQAGDLLINDGYRAKNSELASTGMPFARAGNINNGFHFRDADRFPVGAIGKVGFKISQPGDVVFTSKGTVGRFAFVRADTPQFVYAPQLCFWRSLNHSRLNPRWLYYWMHGHEFYRQYKGVAGQTDMAEYVSLRDQRRMCITVPSQPVQDAIARILGTLDDKIELNRRMSETLETMARTIFKSWFVDFDPVRARMGGRKPDGMDAATAKLFPEGFCKSSAGRIPDGWCMTNLGNETELLTGLAFESQYFLDSEPGIRLARGDNVKEGYFHWGDKARFWPHVTTEIEKYLLAPGDVLIGMDGSKVGRNWTRVRHSDLPCLLVQRVARLRAKTSIGQHFIAILVGNERFQSYVDGVKTGTSIPHISGGQIKSYAFLRPPRGDNRVFHRFEATVLPLVRRQDANVVQNITLASLRDALLPKLLSGELRVADAEKSVEAAL